MGSFNRLPVGSLIGLAVTLVLNENGVNDAATAGTAVTREAIDTEVAVVAIAIVKAKIVVICISPYI